MRPLRPLTVAVVSSVALMGLAPLAHAAFRDTAVASSTFTAGVVAPRTGFTANKTCVTISLLDKTLDLNWTVPSGSWATGQRVTVSGTGSFTYDSGPLPAGQTALSVNLQSVRVGGTYTATLTGTYLGWTSTAVTASDGTC